MMIYGPLPTIQMSDRAPASGASSPMTFGANGWRITPATNPTVRSASSLSSKSKAKMRPEVAHYSLSDAFKGLKRVVSRVLREVMNISNFYNNS